MDKVETFFAALTISRPAAKYKVAYARAYELTLKEAKTALKGWQDSRVWRYNRLKGLGAPKVIVKYAKEQIEKSWIKTLLLKVIKEKEA